MKIEHGTWVIAADGAKYLAMRNIGDEVFLQLEVVAQETSDQPAARDLASDRPGRRNDASRATPGGVASWGKSAMEQTDWHARAEMDERYARRRRRRDIASRLHVYIIFKGVHWESPYPQNISQKIPIANA